MPTQIFCDKAKTFKGTSNQLKELNNLFSPKSLTDTVANYCDSNDIKFKFIPSYASEYGGM